MSQGERTSSRTCRGAAAALALLGLLLCGRSLADWPQFRGPNGLGVSAEVGLPVDFDPDSPNLRWKARIRGEGISSPIVSQGRVFLTNAYRPGGIFVAAAMVALALIAVGSAAARLPFFRPRRPQEDSPDPPPSSALLRLDSLAIVLTSAGFLVVSLLAALDPGRLWETGVPGDTWLITSAVGLTGLVAAFGTFRPQSIWRPVGAAVLLGAAVYAILGLPLNKHLESYRPSLQAAMIAPGVAGALWHLLAFWLLRRHAWVRRDWGATITGPALGAMTLVLFLSCNFVNPRTGLMRGLVCLDLETGEELWNVPLFVAPEGRLHRKNSFATPTPCTDGEFVLAYFGSGYACLDFEGRVLWSARDEDYYERTRYGAVSSPIPFEDTFIILQEKEALGEEADQQDDALSYMMALEKSTGSRRWRIEPAYAHDSYMTPLLMPVGDSTQLITATFGQVVAYDPRSGEKLWSQKLKTHQHVPSLCYAGDLLLVSGGAHLEFRTAGLRLSGSGADTRVEVLWQDKRSVPNSSSPVLHGGSFFTATDMGIMTCYEPETGKRHWRERLSDPGDPFLASLVAADGVVFACTEEGEVLVLTAGTELEIVSRTNLGERIRATPAISDGCILIRGEEHLFCFEGSQGG